MAGRLPPQNLEAEIAVLGGLMLDRDSWDQVVDILSAEAFYKPAHQKIFGAISELQRKGFPIDLITVTNHLQASGEIELVGGVNYLVDILNKTISAAHITSHAEIIRQKSLLRKMINSSTTLIDRAYESDYTDVDSFLDEAEAAFYKLAETKKTDGLSNSMDIVKSSLLKIEELYKRKTDITGVETGFTLLDKMTAGFQPGELIIIAARPSMGKTAFSLNVAQHMAIRQKKTVAYFSLEMSKDAVMMRVLASEAKVSMKNIRSGKISDSEWPKLIEAAGLVGDAKIFIDETSGISPFEVRARARRLKAQHGLDAIIIDYLQLMDLKQKVESRERAVSEISKTLKAIAKELDIPVVALAQLNRGVEGRGDKKPMLSDLRESGSIEQDADVIMMLFRDDYYDKDNPDKKGKAEVIIGKQRNGPTGSVDLRWEPEFGRFRDADPEPSYSPNNNYNNPSQAPQNNTQFSNGKPKNFAPSGNA